MAIYAVAALIFNSQMAFSRWWLERHEQGPAEAFWRLCTYGKIGTPVPASVVGIKLPTVGRKAAWLRSTEHNQFGGAEKWQVLFPANLHAHADRGRC